VGKLLGQLYVNNVILLSGESYFRGKVNEEGWGGEKVKKGRGIEMNFPACHTHSNDVEN